jgi:hypothetical protein
MANEYLIKDGTQLLFADHATDFGAAPATAANSLIIGTPTDVQLDLTGIAAGGGARASTKCSDLGATHAPAYSVMACLEFEGAPADSGAVHFYWVPSPSSTAATGNPGGVTGTDAAFTDSEGNLRQFQYIGNLALRNNVINIGYVGTFQPKQRYGCLIVVNQGTTALRSTATAMDETHIIMQPIIPELQ